MTDTFDLQLAELERQYAADPSNEHCVHRLWQAFERSGQRLAGETLGDWHKALHSEDPSAQLDALKALGQKSWAAAHELERITTLACHEQLHHHRQQHNTACALLIMLGPRAQSQIPKIQGLLVSSDQFYTVWYGELFTTLRALMNDDQALIRWVLSLETPQLIMFGAQKLHALKIDCSGFVDTIIRLLQGPSWATFRSRLSNLLLTMSEPPSPAQKQRLVELLDIPDTGLQLNLMYAFLKHGVEHSERLSRTVLALFCKADVDLLLTLSLKTLKAISNARQQTLLKNWQRQHLRSARLLESIHSWQLRQELRNQWFLLQA